MDSYFGLYSIAFIKYHTLFDSDSPTLDSSLKDGLFHEYKKHGKVTMVKVVGQGTDRFAVVCFKKPEDVDKALVESKVSQKVI